MQKGRMNWNQAEFEAAKKAIGEARFRPYLAAIDEPDGKNREERAIELYLWSGEFAGYLHRQISHLEVSVRNSIDGALRTWNVEQKEASEEWVMEGNTGDLVHRLLRRNLQEARRSAEEASSRRGPKHPRRGTPISHDDIFSQLMFGTWTRLIGGTGAGPEELRQQIWEEAVYKAFPYARKEPLEIKNEDTRREIGRKLEEIRRVRNRVSHHENLLGVNGRTKLDQIYTLLGYIDPNLSKLAGVPGFREFLRSDPRRK